jgi:hypothetical protein
MRINEIILQEDRWDPENMKNEILTLLTSAAAEGITQLSPASLLHDLNAMGYAITMSGLYELLQNEPLIKNMNNDIIELTITDADVFSSPEKSEKDTNKIHNTAVKQANKDIGI